MKECIFPIINKREQIYYQYLNYKLNIAEIYINNILYNRKIF